MNRPTLQWLEEAKKYIGLREVKGSKHNATIQKWLNDLNAGWSDDETPWCGLFTAWCLKQAGISYPKYWYRALDYLNYGTKLLKPAEGCIAIKSRVGGGHVCFVVGITPSGKLVCIGGNQSDSVCYALYNVSDFKEFRWFGKTSKPAEIRYSLPLMTNVTSTKVTEA